MIALLGRPDRPTDALEDYCRCLGEALAKQGSSLPIDRVNWVESGRLRSSLELWRKARTLRGQWVLLQYTALMWSYRGFPLFFLAILWVLKLRGVRVVIVFHDPQAYAGKRLIDLVRRTCQIFVVRFAYWIAERSVFNVPLERVLWLSAQADKASFIPIGANLPKPEFSTAVRNGCLVKTIAVFTMTDGGDISKEVSDIASAALKAAERLSHVRLLIIGRGSRESEPRFRQLLGGSTVEYTAMGILPAYDVSRLLATADVSLFVRGPVSTQRGSAIASIASGVPLVAYSDSRLPAPLAEAGVVAVPYQDAEELAEATVRVLSDGQLRNELHERSRRAHEKYFSWEAVANRFTEVLQGA